MAIPCGTLSILPLSSLLFYYLLSCPLLPFLLSSIVLLLFIIHSPHLAIIKPISSLLPTLNILPLPHAQALRTEGRKARKQVLECVGLVRDLVYLVQLDVRTSDQSEEHSKVRTGLDRSFTCTSSILLSLAEKLNFICM